MQKGWAETLVLVGISRHAKVDPGRSRELAWLLEETLSVVNLMCGIYQQLDQRGVQAIARR